MRHRVLLADGRIRRFVSVVVSVPHVSGTHLQPPRVQPFLGLAASAATADMLRRVPFPGGRRVRRGVRPGAHRQRVGLRPDFQLELYVRVRAQPEADAQSRVRACENGRNVTSVAGLRMNPRPPQIRVTRTFFYRRQVAVDDRQQRRDFLGHQNGRIDSCKPRKQRTFIHGNGFGGCAPFRPWPFDRAYYPTNAGFPPTKSCNVRFARRNAYHVFGIRFSPVAIFRKTTPICFQTRRMRTKYR